jgi:hypothetical protein
LTEITLQSEHAKKYAISYGDQSAEVQIKPGNLVVLDGSLHIIRR